MGVLVGVSVLVGVTDGVTDGDDGAQYVPHDWFCCAGAEQLGPEVLIGIVLAQGLNMACPAGTIY